MTGASDGTMTYFVALAFKRSEERSDVLHATRQRHAAATKRSARPAQDGGRVATAR